MSINPEVLDTLVYYLHERERIRLKKAAGESRPWTSDPILQRFKFTNVLREMDRTTQWLIANWYDPNKDAPLETRLLNCGIARYFGTTEFCRAIGWSSDFSETRQEFIRNMADERMYRGDKVFTSAYVITNGGISDAKFNVVIDHYLEPFSRNLTQIVKRAIESKGWRRPCEYLMTLPGFGGTGFMTKEVMSDFVLATRNTGEIEWNDLYDWTPIGPGAQRGLNWLYDRPVRSKVSRKQALEDLKNVASQLAPRMESFMPTFGSSLDLHGVQFAMCELDKYMRAKTGSGEPKNNYRPYVERP